MIEVKNAIIASVQIGIERGFLDIWFNLDYGNSFQGFGGYAFYLGKDCKRHEKKSYAGHHLFRCMEIAGVDNLKDATGKSVRVGIENGLVKSIGHIVKDDWYSPSEDMK